MALSKDTIICNLQYALAEMAGQAQKFAEQNKALVARNTALSLEVQRIPSRVDNAPKLSRDDVRRIREDRRNGLSQRELADLYNVNPATISRIVRGQYHASVR